MNRVGVSSACYYPQLTEVSFQKLCSNGIKCAELFLNSPSELEAGFIKELCKMKDEYGVEIASVHPFMSFAESFFLFSSYERRFTDIMSLYRRFFEVSAFLNAKIFVIHGAKIPGSVSDELYFERFLKLFETGKEYGVTVSQENVVHYRSESPDFLKKMQSALNGSFQLTLDIKQARRSGVDPFDIVKEFGKNICHVHISDFSDELDCIPPLEGNFDFLNFFELMKNIGYNGKFIIELYQHSYKNEIQITKSYGKICKLLIDY